MRAVLPFLTVLVAGCVSVPTQTLDPAVGAPARDAFGGLGDPLLMGEGHDHENASVHALVTPSMTIHAQETFASLGVPHTVYGEIDLLGEEHAVVTHLLDGFTIVDVSDPKSPRPVSYTPDPGYVGDAKASDDGVHLFVGVQTAAFAGIHVYNVAVRERPVLVGEFPIVGFAPFRGGCHMLAVHRDHLYCAPNDATVRIFEITQTPVAAILTPVGVYAPKGAPLAPVVSPREQGSEITHDMTVQDDPLTGAPVMYVSFWDYGLRVVDVSDPAHPVELGAWLGEGAEETYGGHVHTAMAGMVGGRRVIVTTPEFADVPALTILDATDYAALRAIGVWAPHPREVIEGEARTFSMHNFHLLGERIYLGMYHGGVWVLDASDPARPTPVGYALPTGAPVVGSPIAFGGAPSVWDVVVKDGVILATDIPSGLYAMQFVDDVGAVGLTSFA